MKYQFLFSSNFLFSSIFSIHYIIHIVIYKLYFFWKIWVHWLCNYPPNPPTPNELTAHYIHFLLGCRWYQSVHFSYEWVNSSKMIKNDNAIARYFYPDRIIVLKAMCNTLNSPQVHESFMKTLKGLKIRRRGHWGHFEWKNSTYFFYISSCVFLKAICGYSTLLMVNGHSYMW